MGFLRIPISGLIVAAALFGARGEAGAQPAAAVRDPDCVLDCRQVHTRCAQAAHAAARLCVQSCEDLIAKAKEVCTADPESEECIAASREARACVHECRAALSAALRQCLAQAKDCLVLCPEVQPPVAADPVCLRHCRRLAQACFERAHAAAAECSAPCEDPIGKARQVCAEDPHSEECAEARREASACMQPCREKLAASLRRCSANAHLCAASCRPAVDAFPRPGLR